jgi:UDP-N-acetylmuramate--alanine ligase
MYSLRFYICGTMENVKKVYFIGIGGIGMSALARYFNTHGAKVFGYDKTASTLTRALSREGMIIHYHDAPDLIPTDLDLVIWTPAIPADMRELMWFRAQNVRLYKRAEVLGMLSKTKRAVAIAGTHGKTTTTTITTHVLKYCGFDPSAFLGGIALNFKTNYVEGHSDWVVEEADEYDRSFHQLHPEIAVLNSMDPDHLDIYGTPEAVVESYLKFLSQVKPGGTIIHKYGLDISRVEADLSNNGVQVYTFGYGEGQFAATNWRVKSGWFMFDIETPSGNIEGVQFKFPGRHNMENATAAAAVAYLMGAEKTRIKAALKAFKGVKRRFEYICTSPDLVYIDDYAHHPEELKAAISAARMLYPGKHLTGVFQPHLYSRTNDFADAFAMALDLLDTCVLLDIYPARELPIPGVNSQMLLNKMKLKNKKIVSLADCVEQVASSKGVLMTLGAGSIDTLVQPLKRKIKSIT